MARRRQTMNEYQVASFKEVDTAIINETNKGKLFAAALHSALFLTHSRRSQGFGKGHD